MYVNNVASTSTAKSDSSDKQRKPQDVLGKDDFLKLLTTQLRYQDPINPVDDKEFVAQMAQFSSLEQIQNLNDTLTNSMAVQQQLAALSQATSMLGKSVEIFSKDGESLFGTVSGIQFKSGWPMLEVKGQLYDFTEIVGISEGGKTNEA